MRTLALDEHIQIESAIAAIRAQRAVIGDEAAATAIDALRERLQLLAQADRPSAAAFAGERRIVTILYADISGFTALAEQSDPETIRDLINACFDQLTPCVERFGGTVDKFIGDAIMALFGAPIAHENDPERALRAALAMMDAIQAFNAAHATDLNLHIGINTGLVIAGGIGARNWQQYSVLGDAVNIAARLEDLAADGEILVGPDTYRAGEPLFVFTARKPILLKGKTQPLPIFQVHGFKSQPAAMRGIAGQTTPLIGRSAELARLRAYAADLHHGIGHAVFLVGEAGLGKSRLLAELRATLDPLITTPFAAIDLWLEAQAAAYQSARPYALFQHLFRRMADLSAQATPQQIAAQIDLMLQELTTDNPGSVYSPHSRRVFEVLFGLNDDPAELQMAGEAFRRELFTVVESMLRARLSVGPLILAFDDLHWADPASIELLAALLPSIAAGPLLLLCAFRPEQDSPLQRLIQAEQPDAAPAGEVMQIAPLSPSEARRLLAHFVQIGDPPPALVERILQQADGNPFFVESLLRDLIDRAILIRADDADRWQIADSAASVTIPDTLYALLNTRIDRLSDNARRMLQLAAVIGRSFDEPLLHALAEGDRTLTQSLDELEQTDLIALQSSIPVRQYRFRHTLTQEAAYNSLLIRHRRSYHGRIGATIERLYPERRDELAPTLAYHFGEAGDVQRAIQYYRCAGDSAFRLYAHDNALQYYRHALELAQQHADEGITGDLLIHLFTRFGRSLELRSQFAEAIMLYETMAAYGRTQADPQIELSALLAAATIRSTPTAVRDSQAGAELAQAALELARRLSDPAAEARALWNLQLASIFNGDLDAAISYAEASLHIARAHNFREQMAYTLNDLGLIFLARRGPAAAREVLGEAQQLWRELQNLPLLADCLSNLGLIEQLVGHPRAARQALEEAVQLCRTISNWWGLSFSLTQLIELELEEGHIQAARDRAEEAVQIGRAGGLAFAWTIAPMMLGWVYVHLGLPAQATASAQQAYDHIDTISQQLQSWPLAIGARLALRTGAEQDAAQLLARAYALDDGRQLSSLSAFLLPIAAAEQALVSGEPGRALAMLDELMAQMEAFGARQVWADILLLRGVALRELGQFAAAREAFRAGVAYNEAINTLRMHWPTLLAWSDLEADLGNRAQAAELRAQAETIIATISARISDPELRSAFLATPAVQQALVPAGTALRYPLYP